MAERDGDLGLQEGAGTVAHSPQAMCLAFQIGKAEVVSLAWMAHPSIPTPEWNNMQLADVYMCLSKSSPWIPRCS